MRTSVTSLVLATFLCACGGAQDTDTETTPVTDQPADAPTPESQPIEEPAQDPVATAPEVSAGAPAAAPAAPSVSDGQIASFLSAANQAEIEAGELARKTSKNREVKKLAQMMIKEHTAAEKKAKEVLTRTGVAPEEGEATRSLVDSARGTMEQLKSLKGAEFDRAYVDSQVSMHQQVIDTVDQTMMPGVQNSELRQFMTEVRPKLEAHLQHAKDLQAKLASP